MKRIFLIVLDSVGIGELPDAGQYGDEGSNTLLAASGSNSFYTPNLKKLGLFHIDGVRVDEKHLWAAARGEAAGAFARMEEASRGKDTTIGHWEIAGLISDQPLPVFPEGFPAELISAFERETGRRVLCNRPYSGTEVIKDFGEEQRKTGGLIVYTSADSVFQIAAHEDTVPVEELYKYCEMARRLCSGRYGVGRVIARPFEGEYPFRRTNRRHDFSLAPPGETMLDAISAAGRDVIAVGKISDIFAGRGIGTAIRTEGNEDGIEKTLSCMKQDFEGLCFINLVDFDMVYGHRNDRDGYAGALTAFDKRLPELFMRLRENDILIITADHGCDPVTPSTDHSREYTPLLLYGKRVKEGINLGTRETFADIGAFVLDYLGVPKRIEGTSFLSAVLK